MGRRRFHGDRFESLYQAWSAGTITERDLRLEFSQLKPDRPVFFGPSWCRNTVPQWQSSFVAVTGA